MLWRIFQEETNTGSFNMAADEYLLTYSKQPCIRFYHWKPACISIGYNQLLSDINVEECKKNNVDIVRRPTGGRAVLHDIHDYTYSVIAPLSLFGDLQKAYKEICSWLLVAFKEINIKAELNGTNDIVIGKRKISGNAMVVKNNQLLQHGTIHAKKNFPLLNATLNINADNNAIASLDEFDVKDFAKTLQKHFAKEKDCTLSTFTQDELAMIKQIQEQKYASASWTLGSRNEKQKGACQVILG